MIRGKIYTTRIYILRLYSEQREDISLGYITSLQKKRRNILYLAYPAYSTFLTEEGKYIARIYYVSTKKRENIFKNILREDSKSILYLVYPAYNKTVIGEGEIRSWDIFLYNTVLDYIVSHKYIQYIIKLLDSLSIFVYPGR